MKSALIFVAVFLLLCPLCVGCYVCFKRKGELQTLEEKMVKHNLKKIQASPTITHTLTSITDDDKSETETDQTTEEEPDPGLEDIGLDIDNIPMFTPVSLLTSELI